MARVLLIFIAGLILSILVSLFADLIGISALAIYVVIGLITSFLIWDYAENVMFPVIGFLMLAIVLQYVLYDFVGLFDLVLAVSLFSAAVTLISSVKYLLLIDRPIHAAYR